MRLYRLLFILVITAFVASCQKNIDESDPIILPSEKEIVEFSFPDTSNPGNIKETVKGIIKNNEISLSLPDQVDASGLVAVFKFRGAAVYIGSDKQLSGQNANDFTKEIVYTVKAEDGSSANYTVKLIWLKELKSVTPHIYIDTDNKAPINSTNDYVNANIRIDGKGEYSDYNGRTRIRGRGNSTWNYPKKPYRLKLDKKESMFGLSAEKDWVLLANYLDESLMCNAIAFKTGRLLDMPFTHNIIPADVTLNGVYIGNYMFTEHKEVEKNRIDVVDGGVLLEMDAYFDEPFKFYSKEYNLPVMLQYPELKDLPASQAASQLAAIRADFETFTAAVADPSFPNNNYKNYFNLDAFASYMIVCIFSLNEEINHPKSTYIFKQKNGKYNMGPLWDFDWAFGYEGVYKHFEDPSRPLFWNGTAKGTVFFKRLMEDPAARSLIKQKWIKFKSSQYPKLLSYMKEYADIIKDSYARDYDKWRRSKSPDISLIYAKMVNWLDERVVYMDGLTSGW